MHRDEIHNASRYYLKPNELGLNILFPLHGPLYSRGSVVSETNFDPKLNSFCSF